MSQFGPNFDAAQRHYDNELPKEEPELAPLPAIEAADALALLANLGATTQAGFAAGFAALVANMAESEAYYWEIRDHLLVIAAKRVLEDS